MNACSVARLFLAISDNSVNPTVVFPVTSLCVFRRKKENGVHDKARVEDLTKAVTYTKALFQNAQATYLEILTAQQNLLSAQLTEVSDNVQRMQAVISLYSAVGGGRN